MRYGTRRALRAWIVACASAGRRGAIQEVARIPAAAPLLLFLLLTFLGPIGALLTRGVVDTEFASALPNVAREIRRWDGRALPDETTFAALIDDVRAARQANTLAPRATRLNYDTSGFRSLLFATGRRLPDQLSSSARETLIEIDPRWGEVETWGVISRASGPVTALCSCGGRSPTHRWRRVHRCAGR